MAIYADKKDGKLTGRFRVEVTVGGRRLRDRVNSHKEAQAKEAAFKAMLERGEAPQAKRKFDADRTRPETFSEAIKKARGRLWAGTSTEEGGFQHLWAIQRLMGDRALDAIDTEFVDDLIEALSNLGKADSTINRYLSHFRTFLVWCKGRSYRTKPVAGEDGITFGWKDEDQGRIRWVTEDEEAELYRLHTTDFAALIRIAIRTGMRRTELITVEPDQITPGWCHIWETKSGTPRSVPLTPEDEEDLRWLAGAGSNHSRMPTPSALRYAWDQVRAQMGLKDDPWFVFHACRHTCATRLVMANVNLRVIQTYLGHKRIETTLRYAHVNDQLLTNALQALMGQPALPALPPVLDLAA